MKKITLWILTAVMALCLCACKEKTPEPSETVTEPPRQSASGITPVGSMAAADEDAAYFLRLENYAGQIKGPMTYHVMRLENRPDAEPESLYDHGFMQIQLDNGEWDDSRGFKDNAEYFRDGRLKRITFLLLGCDDDRVYFLELPQQIPDPELDETDFASIALDYGSGLLRWAAKDGKSAGEIGEIPPDFAARLILCLDFCYWYDGEIWAWDRVLNPETGEIRSYGLGDLTDTGFDMQGQPDIVQAKLFKVLDRDADSLTYAYVQSNGELRLCQSQEGKEIILYTKDLRDRSREEHSAFLHGMQYDRDRGMVYLLEDNRLMRVSLDSGAEESIASCGFAQKEIPTECWDYYRPYVLSGKHIYAFYQGELQTIHKDTLVTERKPLENYRDLLFCPNFTSLGNGGCAIWPYNPEGNHQWVRWLPRPIPQMYRYFGEGEILDTGIMP